MTSKNTKPPKQQKPQLPTIRATWELNVLNEGHAVYCERTRPASPSEMAARCKTIVKGLKATLPEGTWTIEAASVEPLNGTLTVDWSGHTTVTYKTAGNSSATEEY